MSLRENCRERLWTVQIFKFYLGILAVEVFLETQNKQKMTTVFLECLLMQWSELPPPMF